jgi:ketol-acid reductoisomerase
MASRTASKALRSSASRQLTAQAPASARRSFVTAVNGSGRRATALAASRLGGYGAVAAPIQQARGVKTIDFAGVKEKVYGESC